MLCGERLAGARYDALVFHWPTTKAFADHLNWHALAEYDSATMPLFHILLAQVPGVGDFTVYRTIGFIIGCMALAAVGCAIHRRFRPFLRDRSLIALLIGAVALSPGLRDATFWGSTDALPLLFLGLSVLLLTDPVTGDWLDRVSGARTVAIAMISAAAFYTRQQYIVVPVLAWWLLLRRSRFGALGVTGLFVAAAAPAAALLVTWHGLTTPSHQGQQSLNPFNLIIVGAALFPTALPFVLSLRRPATKRILVVAGTGAALGLVLSFLPLGISGVGGGIVIKLAMLLGPRGGIIVVSAIAALGWWTLISAARTHRDNALVALLVVTPLAIASPLYERYIDPIAPISIILLATPGVSRTLVQRHSIPMLFCLMLTLEVVTLTWFQIWGHAVPVPPGY